MSLRARRWEGGGFMERSEGRGRREELQRGEEEMREDSRIPGDSLTRIHLRRIVSYQLEN